MIGEAKARIVEIGGDQCAPVELATIAEDISAQSLPECRGQFGFPFQYCVIGTESTGDRVF